MMIYDQIQAGLGTKDDKMVPLGAKREPIGPAIMMEPFLKEIDGRVIACLYCGNGTYLADPDEVSRKLCAMANKVQPDVVICGPAFNFKDYASMAARVAYDINQTTNIKAFAAMSIENEETIANYKDKVNIVVTPKKGGTGLNDSLKNMCQLAKTLANKEDVTALASKICF
jgi:glycine/betaine/sarcosine/D-proline reductase family selenoprotein B